MAAATRIVTCLALPFSGLFRQQPNYALLQLAAQRRSTSSFVLLSTRYLVLVVLRKSHDDVSAPWRRAALARMAVVVMLIGSIASTAFCWVRQLQREQIMTAPLMAKEVDFRVT